MSLFPINREVAVRNLQVLHTLQQHFELRVINPPMRFAGSAVNSLQLDNLVFDFFDMPSLCHLPFHDEICNMHLRHLLRDLHSIENGRRFGEDRINLLQRLSACLRIEEIHYRYKCRAGDRVDDEVLIADVSEPNWCDFNNLYSVKMCVIGLKRSNQGLPGS